VYSDLITFEEHLAGLSAVVVLVVESPGAIAELGAFSISEPFLDRLLVIVSQEHYEQQSFIRLGPVQKIENSSSDAVLVYDWHDRRVGERPVPNFELLREDVSEIVSAIRSYTSPSGREHVFKYEDPSHAMSLICELCDLFGALSESDIHEFLLKMGLDPGLDNIRRYLFLLQKCELLFLKSKGHGRYYYVEEWKSRLSFSFSGDEKFNRERIKVDTVAYYDAVMKSRAEVVRRIRKSS
ncbi:MAG: retron St85 family effector protein, partial [Stenotrophomonas indicatrix]|uniref:retron St85 family effector protein n=1 Tax=Stenotrophomonas indicatrix TaxID=2045451 RepID=UPI003C7C0798